MDQKTKRTEAEARQAAYDKLSLDARIKRAEGRGGSKKELERLQAKKDSQDLRKPAKEPKKKEKEKK